MFAIKFTYRQLPLYRRNVFSNFRTYFITIPLPAGHSKWANIRHTKALKDGQKSAVFTRLARQLRLAIQEGNSSNPALNSNLRSVIDEALRKNMPIASIQNAIKKTEQNKAQLKEYILQMRFKQNIYLVCILYTDNFSGQKMTITPIVKKAGAAFVDAPHLFNDFGLIEAFVSTETLEKIKNANDLEEIATEDAINCGAEDIEVVNYEKGAVNFICDASRLSSVRKAIETKGYIIESADHIFQPKTLVKLPEEHQKAYDVFVQKLLDFPGVEDVYDNVEPTS